MRHRKLLIITVIITSILFSAVNLLSYSTHNEKVIYTMNELFDKVRVWFTGEYKDNRESNAPDSLKTHPWLTLRAIQLFEHQSGIILSDEQKIAIIQGSIEEDYDIEGTSSEPKYSDVKMGDKLDTPTKIKDFTIQSWRCFNHFMNASNSGLGFSSSAVKWATTDEKNYTRFDEAMRLVKEGKIEGWRYLGHVLHLLEDMSVPAHVRGDMHPFKETYELELRSINISDYCSLVGNCDKSKLGTPKSISTNVPDNYFIQLAADTRDNFYSDDTLGILPYSLPSNIVTCDDNYLCNSNKSRSDDNSKKVYVAERRKWIDTLLILSTKSTENPYYKITDTVVKSMFSYLGLQAIQHGSGLISKFYFAATYKEIGTISGNVTRSDTGEPLSGASIRLDIPNSYIQVTTDFNGHYSIPIPSLGSYFLLSVGKSGYIPKTANINKSDLLTSGTLIQDFELDVATENVLILEIVPEVHHLGDDTFSGTMNSQFQQVTEGLLYTKFFVTDTSQLPPNYTTARIYITAKGLQDNNQLYVNDIFVGYLNSSPTDGSFGLNILPLDISTLSTFNKLQIISVDDAGNTYDDFEFANVLIYLYK